MSVEARKALIEHKHLFWSNKGSQQGDISDETKTKTNLIELLTDLLAKGHIIFITCVNSDHHDDTNLGLHCHHNGYAFDCWPQNSVSPGDFCNADDPKMLKFLEDAAIDPIWYQTGLAGSAYTHADVVAAGRGVFADDGADHIHLGVQ